MLLFPNCKINIGLNIKNKRADGYHNLQTIFYPIALKDVLEIIPSGPSSEPISFSSSGLHVQGNTLDNICMKAYQLLQKDYPSIGNIKMHLHKQIPMGAGLGGGSADASFTLQLLNTIFNLKLSQQQLLDYALQLGSDCPFFIVNKPCYASGRGELLEPIELNLYEYAFFILNPGIHISTVLAFSNIIPQENISDLKAAITSPISSWKEVICNDFEKPVFEMYPEIAAIKSQLYAQGAVYASMSGSGSTLYGIFKKGDLPVLNFPAHYFQRWV